MYEFNNKINKYVLSVSLVLFVKIDFQLMCLNYCLFNLVNELAGIMKMKHCIKYALAMCVINLLLFNA